jgi:hypothetical protein
MLTSHGRNTIGEAILDSVLRPDVRHQWAECGQYVRSVRAADIAELPVEAVGTIQICAQKKEDNMVDSAGDHIEPDQKTSVNR